MSEWKTIKLQFIAKVNMGQSPLSISVNRESIGLPFLQANADFGDVNPIPQCWCTSPRKIAKEKELLLSIRAPVGEINIADQDYCIGRGLSSICFFGIHNSFGYYAIQQNLSFLHRRSQGSTFLAVNKKDVSELPLFIPTGAAAAKEQAKIAEVLGAIDAVIEKTKAIIAKYQRIKEGTLQDLLTNGIDEHGQIRSPKTHKYKPSKLGMIPMEWECVALNQAVKVFSGSTPSTASDANWNGDISWLTPADLSVVKYQYIWDSERHLTQTGLRNSTNRLLPAGSLILSSRAPVGYCAIVPMPFSFNQGCKGLVPRQYVDPSFLCYLLATQKKAFERFSSGTTFLEFPKKELARFLLKMPKRNEVGIIEQRHISLKLQQIDSVLERHDETLAKLELQKQGLMQDLLTNRVSVEPLLKKRGQAS